MRTKNIFAYLLIFFLGQTGFARSYDQKEADLCKNWDDAACDKLNTKCGKEKLKECELLATAFTERGQLLDAKIYQEKACGLGSKVMCTSLSNQALEQNNKQANDQKNREMEAQIERLKSQLAAQSELARQNADDEQQIQGLQQLQRALSHPSEPPKKNTQCTSTVNSRFGTIDTFCHEN